MGGGFNGLIVWVKCLQDQYERLCGCCIVGCEQKKGYTKTRTPAKRSEEAHHKKMGAQKKQESERHTHNTCTQTTARKKIPTGKQQKRCLRGQGRAMNVCMCVYVQKAVHIIVQEGRGEVCGELAYASWLLSCT